MTFVSVEFVEVAWKLTVSKACIRPTQRGCNRAAHRVPKKGGLALQAESHPPYGFNP